MEESMANLLIFVVLVFFAPALASATPPLNTVIKYDAATETLHVEASHPSDKLDKHFIRRMHVDIAGKAEDFTFTRQRLAAGFQEDVKVKANPGDHIEVKLFCSQGGTVVGSLDIPPEEAPPEPAPQEKKKPQEVIWEDVI
jgi:hypothetical protein